MFDYLDAEYVHKYKHLSSFGLFIKLVLKS